MKFETPDPKRYQISDCGKYLVEKIAIEGEEPIYAVWEYRRVMYGNRSMKAAVDAIKTRELDRLEAQIEEQERPPESDAKPYFPERAKRTSQSSS